MQPGETRKYGTTIAPGLYAPVHQHFFVARMDMAVDCKPGEAFNQVSLQLYFSVDKVFGFISRTNILIASLLKYPTFPFSGC
jgi:hypothetical protein